MTKNSSPKTITLILLVALFVIPNFLAEPVQANIATPIVKFTGCTAGETLAPWLKDQLDTTIYKLFDKLPASLIDKLNLGGILGSLTGGGSLLSSGTVPVNDADFQKAFVQTQRQIGIQRCLAREVLNGTIQKVLDTARTSGRNGGVSWVTNWRSFQTDSQNRGEGIFRAILSNTQVCDYFSNDIKSLFGATKKSSLPQNTKVGNLDPYALRNRCTMPSNFSLTNYQKDFSGNGGWNAFSRMLEPQNNYYGSLFQSLDEVSRQRSLEQSADLNQVVANKGFTGKSGTDANDSCKTRDPNGLCLEYKDIKTPGSIIDQTTANALQQDMQWITSTDTIAGVIENVTDTLLQRLSNLSDSNDGNYTVFSPPTISEPGGSSGTTTAVCSSTGQAEQNFMLPLLNATPPAAPQDVANLTNQKFSLTTGNEAAYYSDSNTIGLPEFYLAGPTAGRPVSPTTGKPWDVVTRCTSSGGGSSGGGAKNSAI